MVLIKSKFEVKKFFIALLLGFLAVQLVSWIASEYFPEVQILKGGLMLLIFLVVIGITSLFVLGKKLGQLDLKKDLLFILLVFGVIIVLFLFLPDIIPQIFSKSGLEIREFLRGTIGTVMQLGGTGVVG